MKIFQDIKIGDKIYYIDTYRYTIKEDHVTGVLDKDLAHTDYEIHLLHNPLLSVKGTNSSCFNIKKIWFTTLQGAIDFKKHEIRDEIDLHFHRAFQEFRAIKKLSPSDDELRHRIFDFFNMNDDGTKRPSTIKKGTNL